MQLVYSTALADWASVRVGVYIYIYIYIYIYTIESVYIIKIVKKNYFSYLNFWDEAWWFLSLKVFGLLSSSLLLFPQDTWRHGYRCWFPKLLRRQSSGGCRRVTMQEYLTLVWMRETDGEKELGKSVPVARHDDDNDCIYTYKFYTYLMLLMFWKENKMVQFVNNKYCRNWYLGEKSSPPPDKR